MKLLELLNGGKVAIERTEIRGAADTGEVGGLVVGPAVAMAQEGAGVVVTLAKAYIRVREFVGDAILMQVGDVVSGVVDAPFLEVSTENFAFVFVLCADG
jgi:hypothetical protein